MFKKKVLFVFLLTYFLFLNGCKKKEPELPAKGVPFTDSLYGTTIVRITDKDIDNYSGNGIENEYARADAYNRDETYLILRGNDGVFYLYNASNYQLVRSLDHLSGGQELEPRWHATDPNIFYYFSGPNLNSYNITSNAQQIIHNFAQEFPNCSYITTGSEGDASMDRNYWCLMIVDSTFNTIAVVVYELSTDSIIGQKTSFPDAINWVSMDMSGNHAVIGYDSHVCQVFNKNLTSYIDLPAGANGHMDLALDASNNDVMVYQNNATDWIAMADLNTGTETPLVQIPFDVNPDIGLHFSGNCGATPGWVLVSTYGAKNPPKGNTHSWMDNLLFMVELKANPRIIKLAQTHSYTAEDPEDVEKNYFAEAFASINYNGTKVVFGSNWGILSPIDYTDAYQVKMPTGWNQ
ncbi:MAG: hypothetical protein ABIL70_04505 [candidate division WOR-3 bacterium]